MICFVLAHVLNSVDFFVHSHEPRFQWIHLHAKCISPPDFVSSLEGKVKHPISDAGKEYDTQVDLMDPYHLVNKVKTLHLRSFL